MTVTKITKCIACGSKHIHPLLDLGKQPLANSFKKRPDDPEEKYPLATNVCAECFHVQLTHKVDPDLLFKDYIYRSGTAQTQLDYFEWFPLFVEEYRRATTFTVLDIGCNDGSQLDAFKKYGAHTVGIDPAENLYPISSAKGHEIICGYFTGNEFKKWLDPTFDVILCQNAFAHNSDQFAFMKNLFRVMSDDTLAFITTSQADMIINGEFDTIYHEHLSFYNIQSMHKLCERAGLHLVDVVKHPIHGTSYIFIISKSYKNALYMDLRMKEEAQKGLYEFERYEEFGGNAINTMQSYQRFMKHHKGKIPIIGYGAPAKGNTFMNFAGIGPDIIIDDSPSKQGTFTPGLGIPVHPSSKIEDYAHLDQVVFIPLAWNFMDEIVEKISKIRRKKEDIFVTIMPEFMVEKNMFHSWGYTELIQETYPA